MYICTVGQCWEEIFDMQLCQPIWKSEIFCYIGPIQSPPASLHINIYNVNVGNIYWGDLNSDQLSLNQSISKHKLKQKSNIVELQTLKKKLSHHLTRECYLNICMCDKWWVWCVVRGGEGGPAYDNKLMVPVLSYTCSYQI